MKINDFRETFAENPALIYYEEEKENERKVRRGQDITIARQSN